MSTDPCHPQAALKFDAEVHEQGRIELTVPFAPGARVVVVVVQEPAETMDDLVAAAQTSLDFWDNPYDDRD
jgi:hypothetical protein